MTTPEQLLTFVDRVGYERACADIGVDPMADVDAAKIAETGYERLSKLVSAGAGPGQKAALATHLRRSWSIRSGRPESTLIGTPLLEEGM